MANGWPGSGGSGPVAGTIGITDDSSVAALRSYRPKRGGIEFVYDPEHGKFVTGRSKVATLMGTPHQRLVRAIGALDSQVVGGTLRRREDGAFLTTEQSGHYGANWTDFIRRQFCAWLEERTGVQVYHQTWEG
jgi:filamentous hemagglutinin